MLINDPASSEPVSTMLTFNSYDQFNIFQIDIECITIGSALEQACALSDLDVIIHKVNQNLSYYIYNLVHAWMPGMRK